MFISFRDDCRSQLQKSAACSVLMTVGVVEMGFPDTCVSQLLCCTLRAVGSGHGVNRGKWNGSLFFGLTLFQKAMECTPWAGLSKDCVMPQASSFAPLDMANMKRAVDPKLDLRLPLLIEKPPRKQLWTTSKN